MREKFIIAVLIGACIVAAHTPFDLFAHIL